MSLCRRLPEIFSSAALAVALGIAACPAAAQPRGPEIVLSSPRFVVNAVKFKANDETGWDWTGSDEVHAVFVDFNPVRERTTGIYGDVDAGETKTFTSADSCIASQPECDRGASSLHFAIALWESDWSLTEEITGCYPTAPNIHPLYDNGICPGDDLIGRAELSFTQAQLVNMLPTVGNSIAMSVKPGGGSGSYQFTFRITRLPNAERTIVIHEPVGLGISLQAGLINPPSAGRVRLTWSGATAASVDILRGAGLIATTANDGEYIDQVSTGTYQYRVCNGGTTDCSAIASVTVP